MSLHQRDRSAHTPELQPEGTMQADNPKHPGADRTSVFLSQAYMIEGGLVSITDEARGGFLG